MSSINEDEYREYVKCGAAAFDHLQTDWAELVDPSTLDMGRTDRCVGAQVFGSYDACLAALGLGFFDRDVYTYGIDLEGIHALTVRYARLRDAWLVEVEKRLA